MMDSSKRQDGIGGSRLFYIVRAAKFGYGSCGSVVTYNFLKFTHQHRRKILRITTGNTNLVVFDCCDAWEDLKAGAEND